MRLLLGLILPLLLILLPVALLILVRLRCRGIKKGEFGLAIFGCLILGLIVPILATMIGSYGLLYGITSSRPTCITGVAAYFFFGYLINIVGVPVAGVVLFPRKETC